MEDLIHDAIVRKAKGVLRKQRIEAASQHKYAERYRKRTGLVPGTPSTFDPIWWSLHPHFDPRYCISHARYLARVIWRKLQNGTYEPVPAIQFDVPKPDGSTRQIMAFAIPDSALANVIHRSATKRNINLFSSYSFAYRPDKNVFDAMLNLKRSLRGHKAYVIQYDFSKYFDTIDHAYIRRKHLFLHRRGPGGAFNAGRIGHGFGDWDLVTCVNEIRTYIYGGLREAQVRGFLENNLKLPYVRGLMGFLPLMTEIDQLKALDGWLLNVMRRAQRERVRVLASLGHATPILTKAQLLSGSWYGFDPVPNDMTLPSFVRSWRASRKYYLRYGLSGIKPPSYYSLVGYS